MKRTLRILYFVVLLGELLGVYFESITRWITKPSLMIILLVYYVAVSKTKHPSMMLALITALLGDLFLLANVGNIFVVALFCFLLVHLMYTNMFKKQIDAIETIDWIGSLSVVGAGILLGAYIVPQTGSLKVQVSIYIVVIVLMTVMAILRNKQLPGYAMVVLGAMLFLTSDTILALDKFVFPFFFGNILIMATYGLAQYFIVDGYILGEGDSTTWD